MTRRTGGIGINLFYLLGILGLIAVAVLFFAAKASPESVAAEFMQALATKDVKRLTELSYLEEPDPPLEEQWDYCVNKAAKNFVFMWQFEASRRVSEDRQVVKVILMVFNGPFGKEADPVELPLIYKDGRWLVDLTRTPRTFFPFLPS